MVCLEWTVIHINRVVVAMVSVVAVVRATDVDISCKHPDRLERPGTDEEPATGNETSARIDYRSDSVTKNGGLCG